METGIISEQELIKLGFEKQIEEGELDNPFYYYTLDITTGLAFITQANDEVKDGEWVAEIFEASEIKFKDVKLLTELINLLKYSKNENK